MPTSNGSNSNNNTKTRRRPRSLSVGRRKTLRQRRTRPKSVERLKKIVAERVGKGSFGTVSRPPKHCKIFLSKNAGNINRAVFEETYLDNPEYVSKQTDIINAEKELEVANYIKENLPDWREYFCLVEFICGAPDEIRNEFGDYLDTIAIAPYCGVPLNDTSIGYFTKEKKSGYNVYKKPKVYLTEMELCCLVDSLKKLIIGVGKLHSIGVFHQDIHPYNILYNFKNGALYLIDFGGTKSFETINKYKSQFPNNWESTPYINQARLDDIEQLIYDIISPVLSNIITILDLPNVTKKATPVVDECYKKILSDAQKIPRQGTLNSLSKEEQLDILTGYLNYFISDYDEGLQRCKWKNAVVTRTSKTASVRFPTLNALWLNDNK